VSVTNDIVPSPTNQARDAAAVAGTSMTWNDSSGSLPLVADLTCDVAAAPPLRAAQDSASRAPVIHIRPLVDTSLLPEDGEEARVVKAAHKWYEHLISLWAPGIIEAAHDLGVFEALARKPLSSAQVTEALGLDLQATRVLLEALYAYDLIERTCDEEGVALYALSDEATQCLLGDGLYSLSGKIEYDRRLAWNAWRNFADAVRTGCHDASGAGRVNQIRESQYGALVRGINFWAPPITAVLAAELERRGWSANTPARILDVGCGTGLYSQLLLRRFPSWSAIGIDVASIVPVALAQGERVGVRGRFHAVVLDFQNDSWGENFDLVFFANIFHLQTPASARVLLRKAREALAPHGLIAIADHIIDDDQNGHSIQNRFFRLFAASMLATGGGDAYTRRDYEKWLPEAGLRSLALLDAPMHRILLAGPATAV
jgi:SAM-dependent methyltransferase